MMWILNDSDNFQYYSIFIEKHFETLQINCDKLKIVNDELYYENEKIQLPNIVFYRTTKTVYKLLIFFKKKNITTVNKREAILHCKNKVFCHNLVKKLKIKQPNYLSKNITFENCKNSLGLPFILKDTYGKQGENIFLINNETEFVSGIEKLANCESYFAQEFIKSDSADFRATILNKKFIFGIERKNTGVDFRSNLAKGGTCKEWEADKNIISTAEKIADNLNMDFGSVDFMFDGNDYYFCEANSCIGMKSHFILNFNITEKLIEFFEQNYKDLV